MHLLLIAYEFPPSPSPQSLRWAYLARELQRRGHAVTVLTIDLGGAPEGLPEPAPGMVVLRTYPGPLRGLVAWRRKRRMRIIPSDPVLASESEGEPTAGVRPSRKGWKHRVSLVLQRAAEFVHFPDLRGEWRRPARRALDSLLDQESFDVVISSHEPATTLELGLYACRRHGLPWVADLGDPVLAHYTPRRWRARAARLERQTWREAGRVLVTAASARDLLAARHGDATGCRVVTQGFDADIPSASPSGCDGPLRVLYTGSFYSFRRADALVRAVLATAGVVLDIASINVPAPIVALARQNPERIRLRGFLRHDVALANQRTAHVLINLANHDPAQVPGKFYEYLGSGRPLLHVSDAQDDAPARLLRGLQRGWTCGQSETEIKAVLQTLGERHRAGTLEQGLRLDPADVQAHAWQALAGDVERALEEAIAEARGRSPRR